MALYDISSGKLSPVATTSFAAEAILERRHLQQMIRLDPSFLGEDLMVLAEEYGNWEASSRRIDLLCLDKQRCLVVVEIKRTEDGGHMELQAIRYAAMVSSMTLDQAVAAHASMIGGEDAETAARKAVLDFLDVDSIDEVELDEEVRIILVSADFSSEITTAVLWLNRRGLDIRCVRLRPYKLADRVLVDATQIIPLPEAADYEVKIREHDREVRKAKTRRQEIIRRFWSEFIERSRERTQLFSNRSASSDHWLSAGLGRSGFSLHVSVTEDRARVECYIRLGGASDEPSKAAFDALRAKKAMIEASFGEALEWERLPNRIGCRISKDRPGSGWGSDESEWPEIQDWLAEKARLLEQALRVPIQGLAP